jgi:hypothetical protein
MTQAITLPRKPTITYSLNTEPGTETHSIQSSKTCQLQIGQEKTAFHIQCIRFGWSTDSCWEQCLWGAWVWSIFEGDITESWLGCHCIRVEPGSL